MQALNAYTSLESAHSWNSLLPVYSPALVIAVTIAGALLAAGLPLRRDRNSGVFAALVSMASLLALSVFAVIQVPCGEKLCAVGICQLGILAGARLICMGAAMGFVLSALAYQRPQRLLGAAVAVSGILLASGMRSLLMAVAVHEGYRQWSGDDLWNAGVVLCAISILGFCITGAVLLKQWDGPSKNTLVKLSVGLCAAALLVGLTTLSVQRTIPHLGPEATHPKW